MSVHLLRILLLLVASSWTACSLRSSPRHVIGIFGADNGTFSGMSEVYYIERALRNVASLTARYCERAAVGELTTSSGRNISVLVAITGIGGVNAAACTQSILLGLGNDFTFREIIFVGSSGISPTIGGLDPATGCKRQVDPDRLAIGSVCVTATAFDLTCGKCVSNAAAQPNECSRPNCDDHTSVAMFGECSYSGSLSLQLELAAAANRTLLPAQNSFVTMMSQAWWNADEALVNHSSSLPAVAPTVPKILTNCVEADSRTLWISGATDYLCRQYSAELLGSHDGGGGASSTPCVSAMEGFGFLRIIQGASSPSAPIRAAIVRGASDWTMYPLVRVNGSGGDQRWEQNVSYANPIERAIFELEGFRYAVRTSNEVVLSWLRSL